MTPLSVRPLPAASSVPRTAGPESDTAPDNSRRVPSGRAQVQLVDLADHLGAEADLRPLAAEIGSSPRVLLFLFGSKDQLIRALLARARRDELTLPSRLHEAPSPPDLSTAVRALWGWLAAPGHRRLLVLWCEAYTRSLLRPGGPGDDFARQTVDDWLAELARVQPPAVRRTRAGVAERTAALAVLRGALLDLLATGDEARTTAAVEHYLATGRG